MKSNPADSFVKRVVDVFVAVIALVGLVPVFLFVAILVCFFLGKPIFFRQERPGLAGKPFFMIKFRTMLPIFDEHGQPLPDHLRLTRFGRFLRRTSLDELPELWNVLRGDMSLVGPRPLLMKYLSRYSGEQFRRHEARPGVTGLAQVSGRNNLSWEEKFRLDLHYIDNWSLMLDFKILWLTIKTTFAQTGISQVGYETSSEFMGSEDNSLQK